MPLPQANSSEGEPTVFEHLRRLQVREGLTWRQIAKMLGVGVSMLMMVKSGKRGLSARTLYRLEQAEREIAERKSLAERVVDGLLAGEGSAAQILERVSKGVTRVEVPIEYSNPRGAKRLPKIVSLLKPEEMGRARLRRLFGETMDTVVVVLACLPETLRSERFLSRLSADSRVRLTNEALALALPEWKVLAARCARPSNGTEDAGT